MVDSKENILRLIGGEYVSAALKALPNCETATEDFQESVIEVPNLGKVRFTCRQVTCQEFCSHPLSESSC